MTTTPTMPDLLREIVAYCREAGHDWSSLTEAEHMLATLQAQPADVSDAELLGAIARGWCHPKNSGKEVDADLAEAIVEEVRAILALRPHAVPMTDEQRQQAFNKSWATSTDFFAGIVAAEAHHRIGITAPAGGEG